MLAFLLAHVGGDVLLQTEFQATHKAGALTGEPRSRRALAVHGLTYVTAFLPVLVWLGVAGDRTLPVLVAVAVGIVVPHVLVDGGGIVRAWLRAVKHVPDPQPGLAVAVDQAIHAACLLAVALLLTA